jgi:hypothetical protein
MQREFTGARVANVVLGVWLFTTAFAWPHSLAQLANTSAVGVAIVIVAFAGMSRPRLRYLNSVLSAWLFVSALVLPTLSAATVWNNALVALLVFALSFVQSYRAPPRASAGRT